MKAHYYSILITIFFSNLLLAKPRPKPKPTQKPPIVLHYRVQNNTAQSLTIETGTKECALPQYKEKKIPIVAQKSSNRSMQFDACYIDNDHGSELIIEASKRVQRSKADTNGSFTFHVTRNKNDRVIEEKNIVINCAHAASHIVTIKVSGDSLEKTRFQLCVKQTNQNIGGFNLRKRPFIQG